MPANPPDELTDVLRPHLEKVSPLIKPPQSGGPTIYALLIEDARAGEHPGEGVLLGPLNVVDAQTRLLLYCAYPSHMPALKEKIENPHNGKILIVTCEFAAAGGATRTHFAIMEIP